LTYLGSLVSSRSVVVCCGSGGVGKTTISAALALEAASLGKSACVVTIDPARRLADALGIAELTNSPTRIEGDWSGELWALMLDPKGTFDGLVHRYAASPEQAENILATHPEVADVAVFGVPDEEMGEQVKAAVELVAGVSPSGELAAELIAHTREHLAGYKAPRSIDFEERLPRHPTGKLYKRLLRDPYWEGAGRRI
jgi:Zn-dependent alcohol dehydrogenase